MNKKEMIFFILFLIGFIVTYSFLPHEKIPILFTGFFLLILAFVILFFISKESNMQKSIFILIAHLFLTMILVLYFAYLGITIIEYFEFTGINTLIITMLITFLLTTFALFFLLHIFNKFISNDYITNESLKNLRGFSNFLTIIMTILLLINTTFVSVENSLLTNQKKTISESISKLEHYLASNEYTHSKTKYIFSKNGKDTFKEHIDIIENYLIISQKEKVSFATYLKENQIKLAHISSEDKSLNKRINNIESYLLTNTKDSFIAYSKKEGNSIFTPETFNYTYPIKDYYYLFVTMVVYALASYYLFMPSKKKIFKQKKTSNKKLNQISTTHTIPSILLATAIFLFISSHEKKK